MDQELVAYLDRMSQQIEGVRDELRGEIWLSQVFMEGVRSDLQLLAEAIMGTRDQFRRHESEVERRLEEMKVLISLPYRELNTRVSLLEERAERQERDAMEVLREKFGKRPA